MPTFGNNFIVAINLTEEIRGCRSRRLSLTNIDTVFFNGFPEVRTSERPVDHGTREATALHMYYSEAPREAPYRKASETHVLIIYLLRVVRLLSLHIWTIFLVAIKLCINYFTKRLHLLTFLH